MTSKIARPTFEAPAAEWLVYGDALQEANDVRGELVGLSHAVDEGRTPAAIRDAYVERHAAQLLGRAASQLARYTLRWRFSELVAAEIRIGPDDDGPALVRDLLDAPAAQLLTDIALAGVPAAARRVDLAPAMALLASARQITTLGLIDDRARGAKMLVSRDFDPDDNLVTFGPLAPFCDRLRGLTLDVADGYAVTELENLDAPELRSFTFNNLRFCDWEEARGMATRLSTAKWPKLESFALRLTETWVANVPNEIDVYVPVYSAPDYEGRDDVDDGDTEGVNWRDDLPPILATLKHAPLQHLALTSFHSATSLLEALAGSGLVPMLATLDLSDSALGDEHAEWIAAHADLFANLKELILERTGITEPAASKLAKLGPKLRYSAGTGEASYRYVVGQE